MISCQQEKIGFVDNVKLMHDYQEKIDIEAKYKIKLETFGKKKDSITQAFQLEAQAFQAKAQNMSQAESTGRIWDVPTKRTVHWATVATRGTTVAEWKGQTEMDSLVTKVKKRSKATGKPIPMRTS